VISATNVLLIVSITANLIVCEIIFFIPTVKNFELYNRETDSCFLKGENYVIWNSANAGFSHQITGYKLIFTSFTGHFCSQLNYKCVALTAHIFNKLFVSWEKMGKPNIRQLQEYLYNTNRSIRYFVSLLLPMQFQYLGIRQINSKNC
jgi:hypothetical protein